MNRVPVVSQDGQPLMPTKCSKARKLVREGKAIGKWNDLNQYYIQLTFKPSGKETQSIAVGIDPGKNYSGIGLVSKLHTLKAENKLKVVGGYSNFATGEITLINE